MNGRRASFWRGWPGFSLWRRSRCLRKNRRKRWRSRGFFVTSVLAGGAGTCMPAASVLVVGTAPLHTMSRSFIRTHGSAWCWWLVGPGFRGMASLGPFLGAPAGSPGQVKYAGGTGSGAWHPLTPSWVPSVVCRTTAHGRCGGGSACVYRGTDRGMPVPQITPVCGGGQLVWRASTGAVLGQGYGLACCVHDWCLGSSVQKLQLY